MTLEIEIPQLALFEQVQTPSGITEHYSTIWQALEATTSHNATDRQAGLDHLIASDAPRLSPLIAAVLAIRLSDPDIQLRTRIVYVLGDVLEMPAPQVRQHLKGAMVNWTRDNIVFLLEVVDYEPQASAATAALLNLCSQAGELLTEIMADRKVPVSLRQQAIDLIVRVGFLEAIPRLERLTNRLISRSQGQQKMPFAPSCGHGEEVLTPVLRAALATLQTY
jgi:hypothetical protein